MNMTGIAERKHRIACTWKRRWSLAWLGLMVQRVRVRRGKDERALLARREGQPLRRRRGRGIYKAHTERDALSPLSTHAP